MADLIFLTQQALRELDPIGLQVFYIKTIDKGGSKRPSEVHLVEGADVSSLSAAHRRRQRVSRLRIPGEATLMGSGHNSGR